MFRWGVIGTGNIAKTVCDAIVKSGRHKVVAAYSRTAQRAQKFAKRYGAECYNDKEEFFADKNIDAVYIATPHSAHYAYLIDCINHKVPVLTEKSFTVNLEQAKAVFDLAREKKVFVCEAMWTRFAPFLDEIKKWIIKPFVPERVYLAEYAGGALLDLGVYPVSFTHMLLGVPDKTVCDMVVQDGIDYADSIRLYYPSGVSNLYSSLTDLTSFTGTVYGEKGKIVIPNFTRPKKAYLYVDGKKVESKKGKCGYVYEFDKCAEDIRAGRIESSVMTSKDTLEVMEIMDECRRQNALEYPDKVESAEL